jgi:hypothetical protein
VSEKMCSVIFIPLAPTPVCIFEFPNPMSATEGFSLPKVALVLGADVMGVLEAMWEYDYINIDNGYDWLFTL